MTDILALHYRTFLLKSLADILSNSSEELTDFIVKCPDNTSQNQTTSELRTFKLLLVARSKYFEALTRQEPETKVTNLEYDANDVKIILDNLVDMSEDLLKLEVSELLRLLEIADFLQMDILTKVFEELISRQISKENIYYIVKFTEKFQFPNLNAKCFNFVIVNNQQLDFNLFSNSWLFRLADSI